MHSATTSSGTILSSPPPGKTMGRAGSCAVVVIITRGMIFTAHAGDCRAVLIRADEQLRSDDSSSLETNGQAIQTLSTSSSRPFSSLHNQHLRHDNNHNDTICTSSINNPGKTSPESISSSSLSAQVPRRHTHRHNNSGTNNQTENSLHKTKCDASLYSLSTILPHQSNRLSAQSSSTFTTYDKFQNEWENNKRKSPSSGENSSQASSQSSSSSSSLPPQSMKTYSKRTMRKSTPAPPPQPSDFAGIYRGLLAEGITLDHGCDVPKEVEGIRILSNDPNPVRQSDNDRKHLGIRAPLRVAGSLAVARALGDSYLKIAELSTPQYAPHVPYITGRPTISYRPLRSTDRAIILASDGLWNFISANDCAEVLYNHLQTDKCSVATATTTAAVATAALQCTGMDINKENHSVHGKSDVPLDALSSSSLMQRRDALGLGIRPGLNDIKNVNDVNKNTNSSSSNNHDSNMDINIKRNRVLTTSNSSHEEGVTNNSDTNHPLSKRSKGGDEVLHSLQLIKMDEGQSQGQGQGQGPMRKSESKIEAMAPGRGLASGQGQASRLTEPTGISRVYWGGDRHVDSPTSFWFTLDSHTATVPLNACTGFDPTITATANVSLTCHHPSRSLSASSTPSPIPGQNTNHDPGQLPSQMSSQNPDHDPSAAGECKRTDTGNDGDNGDSSGGNGSSGGGSVLGATGVVQLSVFNCSPSPTLSSSRPIDNRGVVAVDDTKGTGKKRVAEKSTETEKGIVLTCDHVIACREDVIQLQAKVDPPLTNP